MRACVLHAGRCNEQHAIPDTLWHQIEELARLHYIAAILPDNVKDRYE